MPSTKHVADAQADFLVVNVTPDFFQVGNAVVPFDITQVLSSEKASYTASVFARGRKVLLVDSVIRGVMGNAGKGIKSGVALGSGNTKVIQGSATVFIEGRRAARHGDQVLMNGDF